MDFKIVGFVHLEGKSTPEHPLPCCDNCQHEIRNIFTIADEQGRRMQVGSECVLLLTARTDAHTQASKIIRRMERAARQWRENKPVRQEGETKEQYIARRMAEMANALHAHKDWHAEYAKLFTPRGSIGCWTWTHDMRVENRARRMGVSVSRTEVIKRHLNRIARRNHANPFDFQKATWDVVKL